MRLPLLINTENMPASSNPYLTDRQSNTEPNGGKLVLLPHERKGEEEKTFGGLFFVHSILVGAFEDLTHQGPLLQTQSLHSQSLRGQHWRLAARIGSPANNAILSEKIQEHSCPVDRFKQNLVSQETAGPAAALLYDPYHVTSGDKLKAPPSPRVAILLQCCLDPAAFVSFSASLPSADESFA
ncbi:hypothetical protein MUK42_37205 [Musa troglodytarum]|uniref:Uncharacterized protein n=1 Tax=Musa troglodytarum TaxID=320322 RepID=A0A9E7GFI9_9LILI|nr:hypothetical protein MUK42_37205 [Musa troglodytarum]